MPKQAVSVTLDEINLLWLRGQAATAGRRSLSDVLDRLITEARTAGRVADTAIRSVVGTIDIDAADPLLEGADAAVRAVFEASLRRPLMVRERSPLYKGAARSTRGKGRRG